MTAPALAQHPVGRKVQVGALCVLALLVCVAIAQVVGRSPELVGGAAAGVVVLRLLLPRLTLSAALLAGSFFYDDYLTDQFGFWNPGKLLGVLAVGALGYSLLRDRRPLVWSSQVLIIAIMASLMAISYTFARDPGIAIQTGIRYVMFFGLFFIILQTVQSRDDIHLIFDVMILTGAFAALIGLNNLFFRGFARASGPLNDPGDFGFQLASVAPLILYRIGTSRGGRRVLYSVALFVVLAAILGTFARAAVVGLVVAAVWAMAAGRLRLRWGAMAVIGVVFIVVAAVQFQPELVEESLAQKQNVAQRNVDSRFGLWEVAFMEWGSAPIFGVGPGNFEVRFPEFRSPLEQKVETTHNAYLNVLAELGIVGFIIFVVYIGESWRQIHLGGGVGLRDPLRTAVAAGFLVALVGAFFMTQQFYPPIWFLAAVGTSLNRIEFDQEEAVAVV